jgi:hypothetical protein
MRHASTGSEAGFEAPVYRPLIAKSAMNGAQLHLNYCLIEYGYDWATCLYFELFSPLHSGKTAVDPLQWQWTETP